MLVLGLTFKENCPDIRNTKVTEVNYEAGQTYGAEVQVHDPWADAAEAKAEYGISLIADTEAPAATTRSSSPSRTSSSSSSASTAFAASAARTP